MICERGASNSVSVIDTAHCNVKPCTGCVRCGYSGPCAQKDDMGSENGTNSGVNSGGIKAEILGADSRTFEALTAHYQTFVRYLNFKDMGMILGKGCGTPDMTARSRYIAEAYELGKSLRG